MEAISENFFGQVNHIALLEHHLRKYVGTSIVASAARQTACMPMPAWCAKSSMLLSRAHVRDSPLVEVTGAALLSHHSVVADFLQHNCTVPKLVYMCVYVSIKISLLVWYLLIIGMLIS